MWARNLLFIGLSLFGLAALAASIFREDRIDNPQDFDQQRLTRPEFAAVIDKINKEFRADWKEKQLHHAKRADDLAIARRLSLGLTGTIPSVEEIDKLRNIAPDHRIEWWVSRILEDRRYADYLGERFARAYVGTDNGPFLVFRRRRFASWLSDQFHDRQTNYKQMVNHLLTDTGLWTGSPSVNFVTATFNKNDDKGPDPISLAARTSRAFLGMRFDCMQCHDDQLGNIRLGTPDDPSEGTQWDFHRLAAFYSQVNSTVGGIKDIGKDPYRYKFLDEDEKEDVEPNVPFARHLLPADGPRRQRLAAWVTHAENKPFARAIVNRIWALMFGRPLVNPIDDIPLHAEFVARVGKYPPALETLADDFVKNGFSIRRLIRIIAATEVFQLERRVDFDITQQHEDHWAVFPLTRLRPEQMAGSMIQSSSLSTIDASASIITQLQRYFQQNNFVQRYGDTGEDEFADHGGTIPQRLVMMNGALLVERTRGNGLLFNAGSQIAILAPDDAKAVEVAYLAVLTRRPSETEANLFAKQLAGTRGEKRIAQLEDLYWSLLNSKEFAWNH